MRNLAPVVFVTLIALWGCGAAEAPAPEPEPEAPAVDVVTEAPADLPMVEVAIDGTEFDPPVEVAQLPDGVWYCDMGTVHYASVEHGDGTCPLCGMDLVHHVAGEQMPEEGGDAHGNTSPAGESS